MTHPPPRRRRRSKGMETGSAVVQFIQRLFYIRKPRSSEYRNEERNSQVCRGVLVLLLLLMGFFGLFRKTTSARGASTFMTASSTKPPPQSSLNSMEPPLFDSVAVQAVVTAALWSFFAGDALASPTHWFYGGFRQVQQYYGPAGITGYTQPVKELAGSILNKSNLSGGGRSSTTTRNQQQPTIIGHVINHGKQDWWNPNKSIHYHATLSAGENTLEASLARLLLQSLAANGGRFDAEHFRSAYVSFMTTPGSHNDTYASTCHRMFFANWYYRKLPPKDCPDNDRHNVDTIDGLVLPTITALAVALHRDGTVAQAAASAAATVAVTRNSALLERYAAEWATLVFAVVRTAATATTASQPVSDTGTTSTTSTSTVSLARTMARNLGLRTPQVKASDEITACYLDSAVPAMLDTLIKYQPPLDIKSANKPSAPWDLVWTGLLANANTGGENVHRGSCLGAVWGAVAAASAVPSMTTSSLRTSPLVNGLFHGSDIQQDIQALLDSIDQEGATEER
jgi:ADP-ribosyl-[dinitrogen reductase] hydrolase